jgi:hypothetical protein
MLTGGGLGDEFERTSGLQAEDPANWQELNRFALSQAKEGGWSPWYGAQGQGITGMMGIAEGRDHPVMGDAPYNPRPQGMDKGNVMPKKPMGIIETIMAQFRPNSSNADSQSNSSKLGGILSSLGGQKQDPPPPMAPIQNAPYQPMADVMMDYGLGQSSDEEEKLKKLLASMGGM